MTCPITECLNTPPSDKGPLCNEHQQIFEVVKWAVDSGEILIAAPCACSSESSDCINREVLETKKAKSRRSK